MIQFTLKCDKDHRFDSWFQSAEAFDKLKAAGMVSCAVCASTDVEKAIMAPRVRPARSAAKAAVPAEPSPGPLSAPASPEEQALAKLKEHVEANSEYVGMEFAREARAMHDGDTPERAIYGEAKPDEAKKLIEDGVPVAPLPFRPGRKTN
ncbi:DUF1178 family protein [Alisedimentitalea sp. MJ-SS2]|uniref:DUF1178 family protein n=1 Tax=Aliisedimentitalea sp. MJ-SS2 TaxID=3049795 RepID=UPI00290B9E33|nr:DUF1178 family protein [Alisedimentitalea sp. MJ-SS2]MDU8928757.1 DUF1178 family protein [Alisedimentitalea sp. MJ-SS2]